MSVVHLGTGNDTVQQIIDQLTEFAEEYDDYLVTGGFVAITANPPPNKEGKGLVLNFIVPPSSFSEAGLLHLTLAMHNDALLGYVLAGEEE